MDDIQTLQDIDRSSGGDTGFEAAAVAGGTFWQSMQQLDAARSYHAQVPAGLHLGAGLAHLATSAPGQGAFALRGAGLTAQWAEDGAPPATTELAAGPNRSCGLFLPATQLGDAHRIETLVRILRDGHTLRSSERVPGVLLAQLCAPLDPWFQGAARELAMEARALQLLALVWAWLDGAPDIDRRADRHLGFARRARERLDASLTAPPTLADLAREVGTNVRTLTTAFRSAFGCSVASYVTRRRLGVACGYLRQGMRVSTAAYRVGYTPAHFSNAFLRHYGVRPQALVGAMPDDASQMPDSA